jgi:hypothetical protein
MIESLIYLAGELGRGGGLRGGAAGIDARGHRRIAGAAPGGRG